MFGPRLGEMEQQTARVKAAAGQELKDLFVPRAVRMRLEKL
jgi:hypothetical protein